MKLLQQNYQIAHSVRNEVGKILKPVYETPEVLGESSPVLLMSVADEE